MISTEQSTERFGERSGEPAAEPPAGSHDAGLHLGVTPRAARGLALLPAWEEPVALCESRRAPWPAAAFSGVLADLVGEVARFTQTPADFPGMMLLAALSVAWAGKVCVEVAPGYREPLMLYVVVAAQTGERKSAVSDLIAGPLLTAPGPLGAELLLDDATPEALEVLMAESGGKAAVFGGEGGAFLDSLGARQRGAGSALYLKGYTGEVHIVRRVGRGVTRIARPVLTIGLMTQPSVLRGLLTREELLHRGFLGRILFAYPQSSALGALEPFMAPVPPALLAAYEELLTAALVVPLPAEVPALVLSEEARAEYERFFRAIERRRQPGGDLARLSEWVPKLRGNVMRVAGLLHLGAHGGGQALRQAITGDAVRRAVLLGEYFISHAQATFLMMGEDGCVARARRLLGWLRQGRRARFTAREAHRYLARLGAREVVLDPVLRLLLANGYIRGGRVAARGGGDRLQHTETYQVNPIEVRRWSEDAGAAEAPAEEQAWARALDDAAPC